MLDINTFDESKIDWKPLPGPDGEPADHISLSILNVDEKAKIVDVLFKFAQQTKRFLCIDIRLTTVLFTVKRRVKDLFS